MIEVHGRTCPTDTRESRTIAIAAVILDIGVSWVGKWCGQCGIFRLPGQVGKLPHDNPWFAGLHQHNSWQGGCRAGTGCGEISWQHAKNQWDRRLAGPQDGIH
jgi:hypothetical protein